MSQPATAPAPEVGEEFPLLRPPGGLMVWLFVLLEGFTFGITLVAFAVQMAAQPEVQRRGQGLLSVPLGTANTLILVTSGLLAALAVIAHERGEARRASWQLGAAGLLGVLFALVKLAEYHAKLGAGLGPGADSFFFFYWALTGFHFLHVLLGAGVLLYLAARVRSGVPFAEPDMSLRTGVVLWHMCDLIWVVIFPLVYLVHG